MYLSPFCFFNIYSFIHWNSKNLTYYFLLRSIFLVNIDRLVVSRDRRQVDEPDMKDTAGEAGMNS